MTDSHLAISLIMELARATTGVSNTQGGRGFKGAVAQQDRAAKRLFIALTGRKPTAEELKSMLE